MQQVYVSLMCGISRNAPEFEISHLCGHLKSSFFKIMATCFDLPWRYLHQTFGEVYTWEQPGSSEGFRLARLTARATVTYLSHCHGNTEDQLCEKCESHSLFCSAGSSLNAALRHILKKIIRGTNDHVHIRTYKKAFSENLILFCRVTANLRENGIFTTHRKLQYLAPSQSSAWVHSSRTYFNM